MQNSAFTGSFIKIPLWYQTFILTQVRTLKGGQRILDFDATDNFSSSVTKVNAMNFQNDVPSIPIERFKDHYALVIDLALMQEATENCHYPELVGEPLPETKLHFSSRKSYTEVIVLGERLSSVANNKFAAVGKKV